MTATSNRTEWLHKKGKNIGWNAGYYKTFESSEGVPLDFVTISGAGHYVPTTRPGPAFQLFSNFLNGEHNYEEQTTYDETPAITKNEFLEKVEDKSKWRTYPINFRGGVLKCYR